MRWRLMPPHTPPTVTTAQSWPTARAAGGRAREPRPSVRVRSSRPASVCLFRAGARQVADRARYIEDQATYNIVAAMDGIRRSYSASNLATPPKMFRNDDATRSPSLLADSRSLSAPGQSFGMHRASAR